MTVWNLSFEEHDDLISKTNMVRALVLWVVVWAVGSLRIQVFLQVNAQIFPHLFEFVKVLLVLVDIFYLGFDACMYVLAFKVSISSVNVESRVCRTFEYSHSGWKVVDSTGCLERGCNDTRRGHKIICESVVQIPLF